MVVSGSHVFLISIEISIFFRTDHNQYKIHKNIIINQRKKFEEIQTIYDNKIKQRLKNDIANNKYFFKKV
jgi:hypothetical protein